AGRVQAWIVGPGAGTGAWTHARVAEALASDVPVLVDADAITLVAGDTALRAAAVARLAPTIFTPHAGEFARLGGDLAAPGGRLAAVRRLAADLHSVVLLKGAATVIAGATGTAAVSASGPPDLATAGSGDVLSGLVGSMIAAQAVGAQTAAGFGDEDLVITAAAGAYLHGLAARLAMADGRPIVSEDVLAQVPAAIAAARGA
ncbi:MAG: ADP-dependent NAD(P)H-hydrate dehydratase / NAD(P)H-hydrate epimerase, partial [Actinomycetota bacterium]|nr:ADP-dependent NAD(P)H-hydrate dehydratase / NAD(P)H-hydrate epimerase [Actinomycetota bacterium]